MLEPGGRNVAIIGEWVSRVYQNLIWASREGCNSSGRPTAQPLDFERNILIVDGLGWPYDMK